MRVGLGVTVWAKGSVSGHLDGIGIYTQSLWRSLQRLASQSESQLSLQSFAFGRNLPFLECGQPQQIARHFSAHALKSALFGPSNRMSTHIRKQVDLFHATDHHIPQLKGVPVVASVMDLIPLIHPEWTSPHLRRAKNWLFSKTIRNADHIITISEHSKLDLVEHLGIAAENISVTPLGVDPVYFQPIDNETRQRTLQSCALSPGFFLCIGTLQPRKNLKRVLAAHRSLPESIRKSNPLLVVGRIGWGVEDLLPELRALEARGEGRWLDYLPRETVLALLQSATATVFPSLYEGFGLPVIEAFAARCPVIAANTTSLPEVAGNAALLVNPLDESSIAQAMSEIIESPDRTEQRVNLGYDRAQKYSWDACRDKTLAIYKQVIQKHA